MSELLDIATRVAGWANDGEQVEAFVVHETETEVRAYEGEVESFTRAESQGVGVRVIVDGKQGYAYAGTLDDTALQETLREARDNASFAEPDEFNGLAVPDGVEPASLELWSDTVGAFPTEDKIALAIELERAALAADTRISGIESAEYIDTAYESAVATSTGIAAAARDRLLRLRVHARRSRWRDPDRFRVLDRPRPERLTRPSPPPMRRPRHSASWGMKPGASGSPSCSTRG